MTTERDAARKLLRSIAYGPPRMGNVATILNGFVSAAQAHLAAYPDELAPTNKEIDELIAEARNWEYDDLVMKLADALAALQERAKRAEAALLASERHNDVLTGDIAAAEAARAALRSDK